MGCWYITMSYNKRFNYIKIKSIITMLVCLDKTLQGGIVIERAINDWTSEWIPIRNKHDKAGFNDKRYDSRDALKRLEVWFRGSREMQAICTAGYRSPHSTLTYCTLHCSVCWITGWHPNKVVQLINCWFVSNWSDCLIEFLHLSDFVSVVSLYSPS